MRCLESQLEKFNIVVYHPRQHGATGPSPGEANLVGLVLRWSPKELTPAEPSTTLLCSTGKPWVGPNVTALERDYLRKVAKLQKS